MKGNYDDARSILRTLVRNGHSAFLAGGCVRDLLLDLEPNDYDIATSATPDVVQGLFKRTLPVGVSFGVVKVVCIGDREIDVATFRTDGAYSDNRRPDTVAYSKTAGEDVKRRDFTINAMLQDVGGNVVDLVGGQADLRNRVIRTVGNPNDRFNEDALRMLRAIRFATRYGFQIEKSTMQAIKQNASLIKNVSKERITEELSKIFSYGDCDVAFWSLLKSDLWCHIIPGTYSRDYYNAMHSLTRIEAGDPFVLSLTAIIFNRYRVDPNAINNYLVLTNSQKNEFKSLFERIPKMTTFLSASLCNKRRMMNWPNKQLVCKAIHCLSANGVTDYDLGKDQSIATVMDDMNAISALGFPDALVNGNDLQEMGYIAGPIFTDMLERIQDEQLEHRLGNAKEVKEFLLKEFPAAPRKLEDGSTYDGMSPRRLIAACKKCSQIMSFQVSFDYKGQIRWTTVANEIGVRGYGYSSIYFECRQCYTRRKKSSFVPAVT